MSEFKFNYVEMDYGHDSYHEGDPVIYITRLSVEAKSKDEAMKIAKAYGKRIAAGNPYQIEDIGDEVKLSREILMDLVLGE